MAKDQFLNYRVIGNGYPVVFIHGFLESNNMWKDLLPSLSNHYRCILIELPGHGESKHFECKTIPQFAQYVRAIIDTLAIANFDIIGHSLGGYVSVELIHQLESFEGKLVLLNSHPWADSASKKEERTRVIDVVQKNKELFIKTAIPNLFRNEHDHKREVESLVNDALKMETTAIVNALIAMRDREERTNVMSTLSSNALVIQGRYDHLIPYEKMEAYASSNSINYTLLNDAGHMAHIETKAEVLNTILGYLT